MTSSHGRMMWRDDVVGRRVPFIIFHLRESSTFVDECDYFLCGLTWKQNLITALPFINTTDVFVSNAFQQLFYTLMHQLMTHHKIRLYTFPSNPEIS